MIIFGDGVARTNCFKGILTGTHGTGRYVKRTGQKLLSRKNIFSSQPGAGGSHL
jgi:hypothetical protein